MESRNTSQREAILTFLNENKIHPTAAEIYEQVKESQPKISMGTVYRNLDKLCEENLVRGIPILGTTRFESLVVEDVHDHFLCSKCNKIIDIHMNEKTNQLKNDFEKNYPSLDADHATVLYTGLCEDCK